MKITAFLVIVFWITVLSTNVRASNLDMEAKATVFLDLISASKDYQGPFGLALPDKEITEIRTYLNLRNTEILSKKQFIARHKKPTQGELAYCFAIKVIEISETHATVIGGNVPMHGFFENQLYLLKRERGRWVIESKQEDSME